MKLLHILSCKSQMDIIHSIKALRVHFQKLQKYAYYEYCDLKAKPWICHDVDLWGLTCPAVPRLTHLFPAPPVPPCRFLLPPDSGQTFHWDHLPLYCPQTTQTYDPFNHIFFRETFCRSPTYPWSVSSWINVLVIAWISQISHLTQSDGAFYCFLFIVLFLHDLVLISRSSGWCHFSLSYFIFYCLNLH